LDGGDDGSGKILHFHFVDVSQIVIFSIFSLMVVTKIKTNGNYLPYKLLLLLTSDFLRHINLAME